MMWRRWRPRSEALERGIYDFRLTKTQWDARSTDLTRTSSFGPNLWGRLATKEAVGRQTTTSIPSTVAGLSDAVWRKSLATQPVLWVVSVWLGAMTATELTVRQPSSTVLLLWCFFGTQLWPLIELDLLQPSGNACSSLGMGTNTQEQSLLQYWAAIQEAIQILQTKRKCCWLSKMYGMFVWWCSCNVISRRAFVLWWQ